MSWLARYLRSSIGAKHVMAVTGLLLFLFAIVHMVGHLQMFGGQDMYNAYAHFLQDLWEVKWPVRAGLLALLARPHRRRARPGREEPRRAPGRLRDVPAGRARRSSGRTMAWTGLALFAFLAFHILHFTVGQVAAEYFHVHGPEGPLRRVHDVRARLPEPGDLRRLPRRHGRCSRCTSVTARRAGCSRSACATRSTRPTGSGPCSPSVLFVGYMIPPTAVLVGIIRLPGA